MDKNYYIIIKKKSLISLFYQQNITKEKLRKNKLLSKLLINISLCQYIYIINLSIHIR